METPYPDDGCISYWRKYPQSAIIGDFFDTNILMITRRHLTEKQIGSHLGTALSSRTAETARAGRQVLSWGLGGITPQGFGLSDTIGSNTKSVE
ncbi:MAG: hypothetical protein EWV92_14530 [Microcystis aeruginosa Ma_MB_S_20031200_S102]|jgi:hypothetical protein|uniref:Uncharacterized protein n=1 Tax=Microcystis aeruginosa Ma_MB_S_20031200_S102 TaxID=2486254 RepID=A0A552EK97_MICAE|nr:MAG: hypothetical protein EWV79_05150 [Microcystis aeruginosa Ma_MB_S_20031200_S102D]TRU34900.1 MAG: hypothetical protein EWV92_14530 [Microcystis aeruginosa Ma_MB_S_20031200_S102]